MSLKITGRITKILPIETGTSKSGKDWKKQAFVIDNYSQYNPDVCFSVFGDEKVEALSKFSEGQEVEVSFNVSSREFNEKYYHNLDAWKIELKSEQFQPTISDIPAAEEADLPY